MRINPDFNFYHYLCTKDKYIMNMQNSIIKPFFPYLFWDYEPITPYLSSFRA